MSTSPPSHPSPTDNEVTYTGSFELEFPLPSDIDPTNLRGSIEEHVKRLEDLKEKALEDPLHAGWSFHAMVEPHPLVDHTENRRDPRPFAHLRKDEAAFRFVLSKPKQAYSPVSNLEEEEEPQWSQVWSAKVFDDQNNNIGVTILKIFQPSLLPYPEPNVAEFGLPTKFQYPHRLANTEHVLYRDERGLASLQGRTVPYYYGKTKVLMPSGEEAIVLIFEPIPGKTLGAWSREFCAAARDPEKQNKCMSELSVIIEKLHNQYKYLNHGGVRVLHLDISLENVMLTPLGWIILVDFAHSSFGSRKELLDWAEPWESPNRLLRVVRDGNRAKFREWAAGEGKAVIKKLHWEKFVGVAEEDREDPHSRPEIAFLPSSLPIIPIARPCRITADGETEDCQLLFNLPFDANNAEEVAAFSAGVQAYAREAQRNPLMRTYDFGAQVVVFDKCSQAANGRALPLFAQSGEQMFRLRLVKPIPSKRLSEDDYEDEGEGERLCQMWEANVVPVTQIGNGPRLEERVVLKIYQQSALKSFQDTRRQLAGSEALAYEKLGAIQGMAVPYMFGLFDLNMPNNEAAYVLVLEYVKGGTLPDFYKSFACSEDNSEAWNQHLGLYKKVLHICFESLQTIHDCGLGHNYMHPRNIIITPPVKPDDQDAIGIHFSAVIVDFRCFNLLEEKRGQRRNDQTKEMDRARIGVFLGGCCDSHCAVVEAAAKEASEKSRDQDN
ncbi:hypothetical protein BDZ89DRAFT_1147648 [Hymenopellis radicata]|nr:hypothetical protein BDZ89DRAFT_1147648 [Hymenopellis radicata]